MAAASILIAREREQSTFPTEELQMLVSGNPGTRERMIDIASADPILGDKTDSVFSVGRKEDYATMLQKWHRCNALTKELGLSAGESGALQEVCGIGSGIGLHSGVFVPTMLKQTTDDQLAAWADNLWPQGKWIGAYTQTEIAHGSNVRGLETSCTYIPETDEFDVHSPDLSSIKWWPGAMGVLCNHCVLYARLIVGEEDLGIHNFLVQLRDIDTHVPLPGIEVGDIGPKWGTNRNDNGYLRLTHVRIPRFNMLAKFKQLDADGTYSSPGPAKGAYGTMTIVRANIVSGAYSGLSSAVTIATRFAAVRQQEPGAVIERVVLDYPSLQYRLLPYLAASYALLFQGRAMVSMNNEAQEQQAEGDFSMAASLHATSSALKSLCTTIGADGIEECRRACGGHGFSMSSGLPQIYTESMTGFTPEGDNWLLTQQTAKYVYGVVQGTGEQAGGVSAYLARYEEMLTERCAATNINEMCELPTLLRAYECRAAAEVATAIGNMEMAATSTEESGDAFMQQLVPHYAVSKAHGLVSVFSAFVASVENMKVDNPALAPVMGRLCSLFALSWIERDLGAFLLSGHISVEQGQLVKKAQTAVLAAVRPDAIGLVDAFGKTDFELNSAIGRSDGNYIAALYELAQKEPLNQSQDKGFDQDHLRFLKDIIHGTTVEDSSVPANQLATAQASKL